MTERALGRGLGLAGSWLAGFWRETAPPRRVVEFRTVAARILVVEQAALLIPIAIAAYFVGNSAIGVLAVGAGFAALSAASYAADGVSLQTRVIIHLGMLMDVLLLIYALSGSGSWQMDGGHMWAFAIWSHCLALLCWRSLLISGALGVAHHFGLVYLLPLWVFPDGANLGRVLLHGAVVAMQMSAFVPLVFFIVNMLGRAEYLEQELEASLQRAAEISHAKSRFLASMSHELRTPLNAILGFSDMMRLQILGSIGNRRYHEYCVDIHNSASHLLSLIGTILDLSRIAAGKMEVSLETIDVVRVCEEAVRLSQPLAAKQRNDLRLVVEGEIPPMTSDVTKLRQCLLNLISNACKYTEDGRVTLRLSAGGANSDRIVAAVEDTGIGIAAEDREAIFEMFTRANTLVARRNEGSGLGLPVTAELARLLGGSVVCASELGRGSVFTLTLPAGTALPAATVSVLQADRAALPEPADTSKAA